MAILYKNKVTPIKSHRLSDCGTTNLQNFWKKKKEKIDKCRILSLNTHCYKQEGLNSGNDKIGKEI